ncbi:RNA-binding domain-containing protein [Synechococcus sp. BDU 130192]|uniref:RNA-binding domain-containing protein n=1 Tax=Synechococcus sp. BDU 130192 TaxID=2042059 RepID=UPI000C081707|nr:RNA-binding domain-containing protein [Synechococcus sp. BDU 130192]
MNLESYRFIKNQIFSYTEDNSLEFKTINPENPDRKKQQERIKKKIWNYFKEYAVSFLNATVPGNLLIGISDLKNEPNYIHGILLESYFKDEIDRNSNEKLKEITPPVPLSCFKIVFHQLYDCHGQIKPDYYIIQFSVSPANEKRILYTTKSGKCWIRRGSSNITLSKENGSFQEETEARKLRNLKRRLDDIEQQLTNDPDDIDLNVQKADILIDLDQGYEASKIYKKFINQSPKNYKIRSRYVKILETQGNLDEALDVLGFAQCNDQNLQDPVWCTTVGVLLRKEKRYKEAINFFKLALKNDPKYRKASYEKKITYKALYNQKYSS